MRTVGHDIRDTAWKEAQAHVREEPPFSNTGPRILTYQRSTGLGGTRWAWCAAFDTWCNEENGIYLNNDAGFASVWFLEQWARQQGFWQPERPGYQPPPGACVIFTFSHTGIVNKKTGAALHTIEGNTSGQGLTGSQSDGGGVFARIRPFHEVKGYVVLPGILAPSKKAVGQKPKKVVYDVFLVDNKLDKQDRKGLSITAALARAKAIVTGGKPVRINRRIIL